MPVSLGLDFKSAAQLTLKGPVSLMPRTLLHWHAQNGAQQAKLSRTWTIFSSKQAVRHAWQPTLQSHTIWTPKPVHCECCCAVTNGDSNDISCIAICKHVVQHYLLSHAAHVTSVVPPCRYQYLKKALKRRQDYCLNHRLAEQDPLRNATFFLILNVRGTDQFYQDVVYATKVFHPSELHFNRSYSDMLTYTGRQVRGPGYFDDNYFPPPCICLVFLPPIHDLSYSCTTYVWHAQIASSGVHQGCQVTMQIEDVSKMQEVETVRRPVATHICHGKGLPRMQTPLSIEMEFSFVGIVTIPLSCAGTQLLEDPIIVALQKTSSESYRRVMPIIDAPRALLKSIDGGDNVLCGCHRCCGLKCFCCFLGNRRRQRTEHHQEHHRKAKHQRKVLLQQRRREVVENMRAVESKHEEGFIRGNDASVGGGEIDMPHSPSTNVASLPEHQQDPDTESSTSDTDGDSEDEGQDDRQMELEWQNEGIKPTRSSVMRHRSRRRGRQCCEKVPPARFLITSRSCAQTTRCLPNLYVVVVSLVCGPQSALLRVQINAFHSLSSHDCVFSPSTRAGTGSRCKQTLVLY